MSPFRIGKTVNSNGVELVVVELFGIPFASSSEMVGRFDREEDFVDYWTRHFTRELVSMLAEQVHAERRPRGWLMATRLSPKPPNIPTIEDQI